MQSNTTDPEVDSGTKDAKRAWIITIVVVVLGIALTLPFVGDPPPKVISIATGQSGGGYMRAGRELARQLKSSGITVEVHETAGSRENLDLLERGEVDLAFVQGGIYKAPAADTEQPFVGLASLYYEPLWVFTRGPEPILQLRELAGKRIQVGADGSGTRAVALTLLDACGATPEVDRLLGDPLQAAIDSLIAGNADALFAVSSPASDFVRQLFQLAAEGELSAVSLERSESLSKHFRYLRPLVLTPGVIDLEHNLPQAPIHIVAPTAGLLARAELHPALIPLVIAGMEEQFRRGELFEREGEFPSGRGLDVPLSLAAEQYYHSGRSFLYRIFPFQLAAALDRLKILLLPLVTLLIPLLRVAPPLYRWRIRSRIFKWYQTIMRIEARLRDQPSSKEFGNAERELEVVEEELRNVTVPLSYAEELYNLRMHARLVRLDVEARVHGGADEEASA
ncbi:MAG: TRAP transporter TAXI family solute receptor [Planctomycetota bacterium]|jgi:TRAP transporter TAXI family solute receptor